MHPTSEPQSVTRRYLTAVIATAVAAALALLIRHPILALAPFLLFYGAVAFSSWYGGTGPGLLSVALGTAAILVILVSPLRIATISSVELAARLCIFIAIGTLIAALNGALRRANFRCAAEAMLARRNEARAQRLAEANLIGVFFSDIRGNITWANAELLRLVGKAQDDLQAGAVNWQSASAPEHRERDQKAVEQLKCDGVCEPYEKDHLVELNQRIPVLVGCALVDPPREEVVGFVLDLTERKRAEAETREQKERLQELSSELMMAEERERRRIAQVLHDAVVQMLALSKMKLDGLRRDVREEPVQKRLEEVYELIDRSIVHTRNLTAQLSPPVLYELGLAAAVQWLGDRIREDHGISFTLRDDRKRKPITEETRIALFHSVRELLMNIVKHAHARRCEVEVRCLDSELRIVVKDDGRGFATNSPVDYSRGGFGLFSIRQRLAHLGGRLEISSEPDAGCRAVIYAPLIKQGDRDEHQDSVGRRSSIGAAGPAQHAGAIGRI